MQVVDFFPGSFAYITAPSVVIPGIGAWLTWLRALLVGFILAPTMLPLSVMMLPHSFAPPEFAALWSLVWGVLTRMLSQNLGLGCGIQT